MNKIVLALLAGSALIWTALTPAEASGGCGPFGHRDWYGYCRPNIRPVYGFGYRRPWGPGWGWHRGWGGPHHWRGW